MVRRLLWRQQVDAEPAIALGHIHGISGDALVAYALEQWVERFAGHSHQFGVKTSFGRGGRQFTHGVVDLAHGERRLPVHLECDHLAQVVARRQRQRQRPPQYHRCGQQQGQSTILAVDGAKRRVEGHGRRLVLGATPAA